jgi:ADP-ribosylglycohydrolase
VPPSIIAFLEADGFEDALRNAIALGGDADTRACIAGGIAEAFFGGVPDEIASRTLAALDARLRGVVSEFRGRFAHRRTR